MDRLFYLRHILNAEQRNGEDWWVPGLNSVNIGAFGRW
jgi:hypothetical protein